MRQAKVGYMGLKTNKQCLFNSKVFYFFTQTSCSNGLSTCYAVCYFGKLGSIQYLIVIYNLMSLSVAETQTPLPGWVV